VNKSLNPDSKCSDAENTNIKLTGSSTIQ